MKKLLKLFKIMPICVTGEGVFTATGSEPKQRGVPNSPERRVRVIYGGKSMEPLSTLSSIYKGLQTGKSEQVQAKSQEIPSKPVASVPVDSYESTVKKDEIVALENQRAQNSAQNTEGLDMLAAKMKLAQQDDMIKGKMLFN